MTKQELEQILESLPSRKIAVIGDGCVDIYWEADMRLSELSREVPHYPLPVVAERFSLGAGANVAANLAAMGVSDIRFVGCVGEDWRGTVFRGVLGGIGVSDRYLVLSSERITPAYCKPIRKGISDIQYEDPRLDFNSRSPLSQELEKQLLSKLEEAAEDADVLIVCDQLQNGCITPAVMERVSRMGRSMTVVADSRDRVGEFRNAIIKPNEIEACRCLGMDASAASDIDIMKQAALILSQRTGCPALVTLGARGVVFAHNGKALLEPAYPVPPPIDFVGAGDAFLAGFSAVCSLGLPPQTALSFSNLVPAVTIRKIGTTGTASPEELREAFCRYQA